MEQYLLPLFCLLCNFVALGACVRFLCVKGGQYWILPALFTLVLGLGNGMLLYGGFGNGEAVSAPLLIDAIVSVLWYAIIITFHYGLKGVIKANNYRERVKKDLAESRWQIKVERRKKEAMGRRLAIAAMGNPQSFDRGIYPESWTDYFDQF